MFLNLEANDGGDVRQRRRTITPAQKEPHEELGKVKKEFFDWLEIKVDT